MLEKLQQAWYSTQRWVWCLLPLTIVFWGLSALRRFLFKVGIKTVTKADIPVIVVGNISVGGNGKTPLVVALVESLTAKGYRPAVLSRGYGSKQTQFPYKVQQTDNASLVGDEPALIFKRLSCDVVIDPKRVRGVQFIMQQTSANVVICDDGLQHYAMARDVELCVIDKRGLGNGFLLPMGPLREGKWRLAHIDGVVLNEGVSPANDHKITPNAGIVLPNNLDLPTHKAFAMQLLPQYWVNLVTHERKSISEFSTLLDSAISLQQAIVAMAGIGHPQRFFDTLDSLNVKYTEAKSFVDHHHFKMTDLPQNGMALMTEKDAVKCSEFAHENCWYLPVSGCLSDEFFSTIEAKILSKAKQFTQSKA